MIFDKYLIFTNIMCDNCILSNIYIGTKEGVSEKTHLSLLALGLSRNTVITLSEKYITNTHMSQSESLAWLRQLDLETLDISPIMREDIHRIL